MVESNYSIIPPGGKPGLTERRALAVLFVFTLLRFAMGFGFELTPQEAYYHFYSTHPALSYFDHPPMLAWSLWAVTSLLGHGPVALRATALLTTLGTQWLFLLVARRTLPSAKRPAALLLFGTTLLVSTFSLVELPDVPLMFFWTLTLLQLLRALFDRDGEGNRPAWLWAGLTMGLAFDSKYTGAALQVSLLLFLLLSPRHRRWLATPWPYLTIAVAHAAMLPVYLWNAEHGWVSLLFQSANRASGVSGLAPLNALKLLGSQAALLGPPLLFAMLYLGWRSLKFAWDYLRPSTAERRAPRPEKRPAKELPLFLLCFFAPLAIPFALLSLFTLVKSNWLAPAYVSGSLLVALFASRRLVRWHLGVSVVAHVAAAIALLFYPVRIESDDTWYGWRELAQRVETLQAQHPETFLFSDDDYKTTAELTYYLERPVYGPNVLGKRALQFDYAGPKLAEIEGRNGLYIDSAPRDFTPGRKGTQRPGLARHFERVEELEPILLMRGGQVQRKFWVYACYSYHAVPTEPEREKER